MQCKTRHSCENNKAQNFHQKPPSTPGTKSNNLLVYAWYQCQPNGTGQNKDSVCRQCCQTDKEDTQSTDYFVLIGENLVIHHVLNKPYMIYRSRVWCSIPSF